MALERVASVTVRRHLKRMLLIYWSGDPTDRELAKEIGLSLARVKQVKKIAREALALLGSPPR